VISFIILNYLVYQVYWSFTSYHLLLIDVSIKLSQYKTMSHYTNAISIHRKSSSKKKCILNSDFVSFLFLIISIIFGFFIKKPIFIQSDGISLSFKVKPVDSESDISYTQSAMFLKMVKHPHIRFSRKSSLLILLLLAGDVEVLPGPDMNPIEHFTKSNGIKIMHQNIRGLLNEKDNLEAIIKEKDSFDIFTLSETHIIENHHQDNDNLYKLEGYRFLKRNRPVGKGGGVAVYITDKLKFVIREDLEMKG